MDIIENNKMLVFDCNKFMHAVKEIDGGCSVCVRNFISNMSEGNPALRLMLCHEFNEYNKKDEWVSFTLHVDGDGEVNDEYK